MLGSNPPSDSRPKGASTDAAAQRPGRLFAPPGLPAVHRARYVRSPAARRNARQKRWAKAPDGSIAGVPLQSSPKPSRATAGAEPAKRTGRRFLGGLSEGFRSALGGCADERKNNCHLHAAVGAASSEPTWDHQPDRSTGRPIDHSINPPRPSPLHQSHAPAAHRAGPFRPERRAGIRPALIRKHSPWPQPPTPPAHTPRHSPSRRSTRAMAQKIPGVTGAAPPRLRRAAPARGRSR